MAKYHDPVKQFLYLKEILRDEYKSLHTSMIIEM